jgi:hypothetical protein
LEGLAIEDVGIFMAILSNLRPNGIFYGRLVHFVLHILAVSVCCTKNNLATLL